eukprot:GHRR01005762.1.p1 GENE.GHRR01005762.1~~GHRR01005762.1.p1  ORF type:complete len:146 (+),score=14.52 GHRR01005762.1:126-563(+)
MSLGKVYVGGIPPGLSESELEREFGRFGPLRSVWVARKPPGFAQRTKAPAALRCVHTPHGLEVASGQQLLQQPCKMHHRQSSSCNSTAAVSFYLHFTASSITSDSLLQSNQLLFMHGRKTTSPLFVTAAQHLHINSHLLFGGASC